MNKKLFILLIAIITLCSACDWLEPNIDQSNQKFFAAATLVHDPSGENIFITDDSIKIFPISKITIPDNQKDSLLNKRYFITFQLGEETKTTDNPMDVNLLSMQMMYDYQVTEISTDSALSAYKNQQLTINRLWCSGSYINFISTIAGSGSKTHNYHLIYNTNVKSDTLFLTLRYDNNDDAGIYTLQNAISYNVGKYLQNNQGDSTVICFNYNSGTPIYDTLYFKIKNK